MSANFRGIRSYSPLESKTQCLDFMPLTMIIGPNGCGKTTIIEALKFIISGDEPPLSDSRRNFINQSDKTVGRGLAYASIKLDFETSRGELGSAKREIIKSNATKTTTISSSYSVNKTNWISVHKQADWARTIPPLFNLPNQAILNYVILCHQEDSLWCMGDSSTVKQIFDKIFGCEQYKKEIKHIDTEIKQCKEFIHYAEKEMQHLREKVEARWHSLNEQKKYEEELRVWQGQIEGLDNSLRSLQGTKQDLDDEIRSHETNALRLQTIKGNLDRVRLQIDSIKKSLRDDEIGLDVTKADLENRREAHIILVKETRRKKIVLARETDQQKSMIDSLTQQAKQWQSQLNDLKVLELKSADAHKHLVDTVDFLRVKYDIDGLTGDDLLESLECMQRHLDNLTRRNNETLKLQSEARAKIKDVTSEHSRSNRNLESLEVRLSIKKSEIKRFESEVEKADPVEKNLITLKSNIQEMSTIVSQLDLKSPAEKQLGSLVSNSALLVDSVIKTVCDDRINGLQAKIDMENLAIEKYERDLVDAKLKSQELSDLKDDLDRQYTEKKDADKQESLEQSQFQEAYRNFKSKLQTYLGDKAKLSDEGNRRMAERVDESAEKILKAREKIESLTKESEEVSKRLEESFEQQDELQKNLDLRIMYDEENKIEESIRVLNQKQQEIDLPDLRDRLTQLDKEILELRERKSQLQGKSMVNRTELAKMVAVLKNSAKVDEEYANRIGWYETNRICLSDLEKLKECFQQSVTNFHNQMIAKINEVLKFRWRQIYKGSDIDSIELVDEEIVKGKNNRAFNYYIAMRKRGMVMKMREKSSAGQKALAAIILRMTLAELLVKDFALIALDEPTANLDIDNVKSLATTIGNYVKRRKRKSANIQWIIITHDEEFLRALDAESSPYYYKVQLDDEGSSKIVKMAFQDAEVKSEGTSQATTQDSGRA